MSNRILIRSGSGIPTIENLEELELGFDTIGKKLYIKYNNEILPIGPTNQEIVDSICKVGHIFITTNSENPNTYLGGEWESFGPGKTLISVDPSDEDFSKVEKSGGQKELDLTHIHSTLEHSLDISELPSHNHLMKHTHSHTFNIADHTHGMTHLHRISGSHNSSADGHHQHLIGYGNSESGAEGNPVGLDGGSWSGYHLTWQSGLNRQYSTLRAVGQMSGTGIIDTHIHQINMNTQNYTGLTSSTSLTINGSIDNYLGSTSLSGEGRPHSHGDTQKALSTKSIMNPYITVYMWKRIS